MELLCYPLTALITGCHPAAEQYTDAAAAIPPEQWRHVQRVTICDFHFGAVDLEAGEILLPAVLDTDSLRHEVGYLVAHANDAELGKLFAFIFGYEWRARQKTISKHAASSPAEDFAVSHRAPLGGRL